MDLKQTYARIGEYIDAHDSQTYGQIAGTLGLSRHQVSRIARLRGIRRRPGKRASLEAALAAIEAASLGPGSASTGDVAATPAEEPILAMPDAPPTAEAPETTPETPLAENAAA